MATDAVITGIESGCRERASTVLRERVKRMRLRADALSYLALLIEKNVDSGSHTEEALWSWACEIRDI